MQVLAPMTMLGQTSFFAWWQWVALAALIVLIVFYFQYKKRQQ